MGFIYKNMPEAFDRFFPDWQFAGKRLIYQFLQHGYLAMRRYPQFLRGNIVGFYKPIFKSEEMNIFIQFALVLLIWVALFYIGDQYFLMNDEQLPVLRAMP